MKLSAAFGIEPIKVVVSGARGGPGPTGNDGNDGNDGVNGGVGSSAGYGGLFSAASGMAVGAGITRVKLSGYSAAGVGGADYIYDAAVDAAFVAANPRTAFLAADGRGFKLDALQRLEVEMFGAIGDFVSDGNRGTDNYAAIMAALTFAPAADRNYSPPINANGRYYSSQTLEPHTVFTLVGMRRNVFNTSVLAGNRPAAIITPTNTTCIIVASGGTSGATGTAAGAKGAAMSYIGGITFEQTTQGTDTTAHAVLARGTVKIENCTYFNIAGNGEHFEAWTDGGGPVGNCNDWRSHNNFAHSVGGNGHAAIGSDANGGLCTGFVTHVVGRAGILNKTYFTCTYECPQLTGYGSYGVQYAGRAWQPVSTSPNLHGSVAPGTNAQVWYDRGPLAAPTASFVAWTNGIVMAACGPVICSGPSHFDGVYIEGNNDYGYAHAPNATVVGADMGWTHLTPVCQVAADYGLVSKRGIGHLRGVEGKGAAHPAYAAIGDGEYTVIGAVNPNVPGDPFKRAAVLSHYVKDTGFQFGYFTFQGFDSPDLNFIANGRPAFYITGTGTARQFNRGSAQNGWFVLPDYGLVDATDGGTAIVHGIRGYLPANGDEAANGDFRWDARNSNILGWKKASGVWTEARAITQQPAIADVGAAPTQAQFNALLATLRAAGVIAG